jgi:IgGFc binding protein
VRARSSSGKQAGTVAALVMVAALAACASTKPFGSAPDDGGAGSGSSGGGAGSSSGTTLTPPLSAPDGGGGDANAEQPATCAEAANDKSYVGCEFWPTVVFNPVWSVFDFAAVVANASTQPAQVAVDRNGTSVASVTIPAGGIAPVILPWVTELKGGDFDDATNGSRPTTSVLVPGGAYHLTSSVPVTVWQYNPLEYEVDVSKCPYPPSAANGDGVNCLSVSNDASLLLPTAAMTGSYRVFGMPADNTASDGVAADSTDSPDAIAITGTTAGTTVTVSLVAGANVVAGTGVTAATGPGTLTFTLGAGDVVELLASSGQFWGDPDSDLSGSLVTANQPVQVISLNAITDVPSPAVDGQGYADHLEETVLPAESLGSHYVVAPPTTPNGTTVGHYVRFFGNRDGTTLTYPSGAPPAGAPTTLSAGQVVQLPAAVTDAFEVQGSNEFAVASIMMGGEAQDPSSDDPQGDPSMSFEVAVEQFRSTYIFLAPTDYAESYADILVPPGAKVTLDGAALTGTSTPIDSGWAVFRELLSTTGTGAHKLQSDQPVGLQIMGFGHATSYYTPGGLNLNHIAPPPVIPPPR